MILNKHSFVECGCCNLYYLINHHHTVIWWCSCWKNSSVPLRLMFWMYFTVGWLVQDSNDVTARHGRRLGRYQRSSRSASCAVRNSRPLWAASAASAVTQRFPKKLWALWFTGRNFALIKLKAPVVRSLVSVEFIYSDWNPIYHRFSRWKVSV